MPPVNVLVWCRWKGTGYLTGRMNRRSWADSRHILANWIGPKHFESAAADKKAGISNTVESENWRRSVKYSTEHWSNSSVDLSYSTSGWSDSSIKLSYLTSRWSNSSIDLYLCIHHFLERSLFGDVWGSAVSTPRESRRFGDVTGRNILVRHLKWRCRWNVTFGGDFAGKVLL